MHRYLATFKSSVSNKPIITYFLVSADNLDKAREIIYKSKQIIILDDKFYLKLYNPKIDGNKYINAYISENWIRLRNE